MKQHVHRAASTCRCYMMADEPSEKCPQHGSPQPVCQDCGQFLPWDYPFFAVNTK